MHLVRDWVAHPPKLIWRIPVGAGWSGFAIDRGLAITQEQRGANEMVVAYDLLTGAPRWSHGDAVRYDSVIAGDGPRATPTISGAYVATLGSTGRLNVLDFRTGRRLWSKDIAADNQATNPEWGRSGSPLILDGKVIVSAGGGDGKSLVAYDARTGARVWSGAVLALAGSRDEGYTSVGPEGVRRRPPRARSSQIIEDAGHAAHLQQPERVAALIEEFRSNLG